MLFVFSPYRSPLTNSRANSRGSSSHNSSKGLQVQNLTLKVPFMVTEVCQVAMVPELWPRLTSQVPCLPAVRMTLPCWCQALTESPHRLAFHTYQKTIWVVRIGLQKFVKWQWSLSCPSWQIKFLFCRRWGWPSLIDVKHWRSHHTG